MKIRTEINQKKNVRVHIVSGQFDVETLYDSLTEMYTSLPLHTDMNVLWDFRATEGIGSLATDQLDKVIGLVGNKWTSGGRYKSALVVSRQADFGLARMYEQELKNQALGKIRVFKDIKKAVRWIDQGTN